MRAFLCLLFCIIISSCFSQRTHYRKYNPDKICISEEVMKLYTIVNEHRQEHNLPKIPLSKALCHVAQIHAEDLDLKLKELTHSWSTCKYNNRNTKTYYCMWNKPKELTSYTSDGYECAHGGTDGYIATAEKALTSWKNSKSHNNVIINKDIWETSKWKAIGIGIHGGFATLWFGEIIDSDGSPIICDD